MTTWGSLPLYKDPGPKTYFKRPWPLVGRFGGEGGGFLLRDGMVKCGGECDLIFCTDMDAKTTKK